MKLQLGTRCNPRPLCPRKRTSVPTEEKAGWVPEPVWEIIWRKNPLAPAAIRVLVSPVRSLIATPTELSRVSALHVKKSVGTLAKVPRDCCSNLSRLLVWMGRHPQTVLERVGNVVLACQLDRAAMTIRKGVWERERDRERERERERVRELVKELGFVLNPGNKWYCMDFTNVQELFRRYSH
jgi:hypothetical protein